jgi:hypothetical protein
MTKRVAATTDVSVCPWIPDVLQPYRRDAYLKYLKGTKREAMSMAFDRARDQQLDLINAAAKRFTPADREYIVAARTERDHVIAKAVEKATATMARKLNRRFKTTASGWWWENSTNRYGYKDVLANLISHSLGNSISDIVVKLKDFRTSLNPKPPNHITPPVTTERKAKLTKSKSAAIKLLGTFTDTLQAK